MRRNLDRTEIDSTAGFLPSLSPALARYTVACKYGEDDREFLRELGRLRGERKKDSDHLASSIFGSFPQLDSNFLEYIVAFEYRNDARVKGILASHGLEIGPGGEINRKPKPFEFWAAVFIPRAGLFDGLHSGKRKKSLTSSPDSVAGLPGAPLSRGEIPLETVPTKVVNGVVYELRDVGGFKVWLEANPLASSPQGKQPATLGPTQSTPAWLEQFAGPYPSGPTTQPPPAPLEQFAGSYRTGFTVRPSPPIDAASILSGRNEVNPNFHFESESTFFFVIPKEEVAFYVGQNTPPPAPDHRSGFYPVKDFDQGLARRYGRYWTVSRFILNFLSFGSIDNVAGVENLLNIPDHLLSAGQHANRWVWYSQRGQSGKGLLELAQGVGEASDAVVGAELGVSALKGSLPTLRRLATDDRGSIGPELKSPLPPEITATLSPDPVRSALPSRLPIVNPNFIPTITPEAAFQGATLRVAARLEANRTIIQNYLSPGETRLSTYGPWAERIVYGNAVERGIAQGSAPTGLLIHTGDIRPAPLGGPDFIGAAGTPYEGLSFQLTSQRGFVSHVLTSPPETIFGLYPTYVP